MTKRASGRKRWSEQRWKNATFNLEPRLYEKLLALAASEQRSRSFLVREALAKLFAAREPAVERPA